MFWAAMLTNMKTLGVILFAMTLFTSGIDQLNAHKLSDNAVMNVLRKWEGRWKSNTIFKKSVWIAEKMELESSTEIRVPLKTASGN